MKKEIRNLLGSDKLIVGTDRVLKAVRKGGVVKVILSSNAPETVREELIRYQRLGASFELITLEMPNDELGTLCKKPFSIAVLAIRS